MTSNKTNKTYKVRIIKCTCSACVPNRYYSFSWYCKRIGEIYEVDDYETSPKDFWHVIGKPQQAKSGCWIKKADTEIIYFEGLPNSLFEL